jgi:hypothetical protein
MTTKSIKIETSFKTTGSDEIKKVLESINKGFKGAQAAVKALGAGVKSAFDPKPVRDYIKDLKQLEQAYENVGQAAQQMGPTAGGPRGAIGPSGPTEMGSGYRGPRLVPGGDGGIPPVHKSWNDSGENWSNKGPGSSGGGGGGSGFLTRNMFGEGGEAAAQMWALKTIIAAPQALLNASQNSASIPLGAAAASQGFNSFLLGQTSGTDAKFAYYTGANTAQRNAFADLKNPQGRAKYMDVANQIGDMGFSAAGGNVYAQNQAPVSFRVRTLNGMSYADAGHAFPNGKTSIPESEYRALEKQSNGGRDSSSSALEKVAAGIGGLKDVITNSGAGIKGNLTGGAEGAQATALVDAWQKIMASNPMLNAAFDQAGATAETAVMYGLRSGSGYHRDTSYGRAFGLTAAQSIGMAGGFNETAGNTRASRMMGSMFEGVRAGISAPTSGGVLSALSQINGGAGTTIGSQTNGANNQFADYLAKAVSRGLDDSQMADDVLKTIETTSNGVGGRQGTGLADAILGMWDSKSMDRLDIKNAVSGYQAAGSAVSGGGYFHQKALSASIRDLGAAGIHNNHLSEIVANANPFEKRIEALSNYGKAQGMSQSQVDSLMQQINNDKFTAFLNNGGIDPKMRAMLTGKSLEERKSILQHASPEQQEGMKLAFAREFGNGQYGTGQGFWNDFMGNGSPVAFKKGARYSHGGNELDEANQGNKARVEGANEQELSKPMIGPDGQPMRDADGNVITIRSYTANRQKNIGVQTRQDMENGQNPNGDPLSNVGKVAKSLADHLKALDDVLVNLLHNQH